MITRADLIGKELGLNAWGNMTYDQGFLEKYLPGEFDYHSDDGEGNFLANLCLYLLSGKSDPAPFFTEEKDRLFLEHFIFHTISKSKFQAKISEAPEDELKVEAILSLIRTDIKLETTIRFHDFYINGYKYFEPANKNQAILYCQNLVEIFNKSGRSDNWAPPFNWEQFTTVCEQHNIPISKKAPPAAAPREAIDILLSEYKQNRTLVVDYKTGRTKQYFHNSIFAPFQKSFKQKIAAVETLEQALNGENVDLSKHLSTLRDGRLGKDLRAFIKAGHANELVGKEVSTVRGFIAALQAKNAPEISFSH